MLNGRMVYRELKSPLGHMIAGGTEKGVSFLEWQDRGGVEKILNRVAKRYKLSPQKGDNRHLDMLETELTSYFTGKLKEFTVPVDVTGTPFEQKTWEKLLAIPYGQTRSYSQIASQLGKPNARRAVGRANGANYLSIVIPCHRVLEANGNLRGYGGRVWRKKYLLELERGERNLLP